MNTALLATLLIAGTAAAETGWSRYQIILERSPFGKQPPTEESAAPARPVGEFAKQYRLSMLYQDAHGQLKAGLVSKTDNKNLFLQIGESQKGLSLVEVRLEEGIAVLSQGGETAQLLLEGLGTPIGSLSQKTAIASSLSVGGSAPKQIRRAGSKALPEHIAAALVDPSPKQAQLVVRTTPIEIAQARPSGNYLVQGVPQRHNPFL